MKILFFLLALSASAAFAQPPVIDSMLIDESNGVLSVYGDFGNTQGKVWCDSVELPVVSWSASLITATIPDTGMGSAGGVVVGARGYQSEKRVLTLWHSDVTYITRWTGSGGASDRTDAYFYLYWRYDVHSILKSSNKSRFVNFSGMLSSHDYQQRTTQKAIFDKDTSKPFYTLDSGSRKPLIYAVHFHIPNRRIDVDIDVWERQWWGSFQKPGYILDSNFAIQRKDTGYGSGATTWVTKWAEVSPSFNPPAKAIALQHNPSIIAIKTGSTNIGTDDAVLRWDSLKLMEKYHVQVSKDSIVNSAHKGGQSPQSVTFVVDSVVSSLDFKLPPLEKNTKYYWRVAGVNSEGQSNWSEQWNFTTGTSADVRSSRRGDLSLSIYPNPSSKESTITFTTPKRGRARLIVYDMTGRVVSTLFDGMSEGKHEISFDASQFAAGSYIVGLVCGKDQVSEIIRVVR